MSVRGHCNCQTYLSAAGRCTNADTELSDVLYLEISPHANSLHEFYGKFVTFMWQLLSNRHTTFNYTNIQTNVRRIRSIWKGVCMYVRVHCGWRGCEKRENFKNSSKRNCKNFAPHLLWNMALAFVVANFIALIYVCIYMYDVWSVGLRLFLVALVEWQ